ncbi:BTAD domain-containing putative transcriptional regulator [Streptomyces sp. NPDC004667]|uniref:AfsR/SARP family transcriptional regulator n=1 Tax=Streptomyces sp. NPDC004667 TaxID=3154285 RepID=UPI0033A91F07
MEFRVLGEVAVATEGGEDLPLGPAKRRSVLAVLLVHANTTVTVDRLAQALWDNEPPRHARTVLHGHISRLRGLFATHRAQAYGVELVTLGTAYLLRVPPERLDAHRFGELLRLARTRTEPEETAALLHDALALWRGTALQGTAATRALGSAAHALEELRLTAVQELAESRARLGDHASAVSVLRAAAAAHPLREQLAAALMGALARAGRATEARELFLRTRALLAQRSGAEPGPALVHAYSALPGGEADAVSATPDESHPHGTGAVATGGLHVGGAVDTGDAAGTTTAGGTARRRLPGAVLTRPTPPDAVADPVAVADLLPRRTRGFAGRAGELAALDRATAGLPGPLATIIGGAGTGKTALAVHWAHRRRSDFPDGLLFVDLRGYSPAPARDTTSVLREFLLALGVPADGIPQTPDGMAARYRALTAGRRLLVVLDNARGSRQVRPLLPGGEHCVTLVTSRDRLDGLVASDAARPLPLAALPTDESLALLAAVLGEEPVRAEPEPAARLVRLCEGLPLALRVAAARIATRPHTGLGRLADELADEQQRLELLDLEDTGVAAALGLTVHHLPDPARRMFRSLGVHTGGTLDTGTAAALAGCSPRQAASALDRLAAAHLLTPTGPESYAVHDLVRLFARTDSPVADPRATARLLDHWLHTLLAAAAAAEPGSEPCCTLPAGTGRAAGVRRFGDRADALAWYAAERDTLRGAVATAVDARLHSHAWRLVLLQWPLVLWQSRDGWTPLLELGLRSAEEAGEPGAQSRARALLGWVLIEEGRPEEALTHLERAPALAALAGDTAGEAVARINLAAALGGHGRHEQAREQLARALVLAERGAPAETVTLAHLHLARHFVSTGAYPEAAEHASNGLALAAPPVSAPRRVVLRTLSGEALAGMGRTEDAVRQLTDAVREAAAHAYAEGESAARAALTALGAGGGPVRL